MKFEPFIADRLLRSSNRRRSGVPVQLVLSHDLQAPLKFVLRRHKAKRDHFDFRIECLRTLFSIVFLDSISLDPRKPSRVKIMEDHNPSYRLGEHVIPAGKPGDGPTMPVDEGGCVPMGERGANYNLEMLRQLESGDYRFVLSGTHMKGAWQLKRIRGDLWKFRKLPDEHATGGILAPDVSIISGRTLKQLRESWKSKGV